MPTVMTGTTLTTIAAVLVGFLLCYDIISSQNKDLHVVIGIELFFESPGVLLFRNASYFTHRKTCIHTD